MNCERAKDPVDRTAMTLSRIEYFGLGPARRRLPGPARHGLLNGRTAGHFSALAKQTLLGNRLATEGGEPVSGARTGYIKHRGRAQVCCLSHSATYRFMRAFAVWAIRQLNRLHRYHNYGDNNDRSLSWSICRRSPAAKEPRQKPASTRLPATVLLIDHESDDRSVSRMVLGSAVTLSSRQPMPLRRWHCASADCDSHWS